MPIHVTLQPFPTLHCAILKPSGMGHKEEAVPIDHLAGSNNLRVDQAHEKDRIEDMHWITVEI